MKSSTRYLITTADERSWRNDVPVLFLGEWCANFNRKNTWNKLDFKIMRCHWSPGEKFHEDYQVLSEFYERILGLVSDKLNEIHGVRKSLRYWRILIGPWLATFIHTLFDRWCSIHFAINNFDIAGTTILNFQEQLLVPESTEHFFELIATDEWNHFIYSNIIQGYTSIPHKTINVVSVVKNTIPHKSWKNFLIRYCSQSFKFLTQSNEAFFLTTYLSRLDELKLHIKFRQVPKIWLPLTFEHLDIVLKSRNFKIEPRELGGFESFLCQMLPRQMPKVFLEGYDALVSQVKALPWPKNPKVMFASNSFFDQTIPMAYFASKTERGIPLVLGQHGGTYGTSQFSWQEDHELAISDRYLTWGWSCHKNSKVRPLGVLSPYKSNQYKNNFKNELLIVCLQSNRYLNTLQSESLVMSNQYINNCFIFIEKLNPCIRGDALVRLHRNDSGWNQSERWKAMFPKINIDSGQRKIGDLFSSAKLCVATYNGTSYLQTLSEGIPTIIFWDNKVTQLRQAALPYFEALKTAKVLHDNPESAAMHINAIWDDLDEWWNSELVQNAVKEFSNYYCKKPNDLLGEIKENVLEAIPTQAEDRALI